MNYTVKAPKKLIEVALPLDAINEAAAREKSIRHGHPSTLHLWWARRPLAAARAVIFAQLVNDPSWKWELENPGKVPPSHLKASWAKSRKRLFGILSELVKWENTTNEEVLEKAREEIRKSWRETCELNKGQAQAAELFNPEKLPGFHDPFAGGGAIPLEAQRLGLEAYASDLNPVAVLINKAMIEIPPKFAGRPPVGPLAKGSQETVTTWPGATGLAEDVRRYGAWMRAEAEKRIGHLYPKVEITGDMVKERPDLKPFKGEELTVIAWIWARTVKSPNPAFSHVDVPLAATFMLGTKPGKEVYVEPVVRGDNYQFKIRTGKPKNYEATKSGTKHSRGNFGCLLSGAPISGDYIKAEARAGRMGSRLMAIVAEGVRGRVYVSPTAEHEKVAIESKPEWKPDVEFFQEALGFRVGNYGMTLWSDLFTKRQLAALTELTNLVQECRARVRHDKSRAGATERDAMAYADAIATYLGLLVGRVSDYCSTVCTWANNPQMEIVRGTYARQALPMTWDFAETNPFGSSTGSLDILLGWIGKVIERLPANLPGFAFQDDAARGERSPAASVISTDPPYFDNIGYSDLSDFFYVWFRRALRGVFPDLFATMVTPKAEELVATPARHGGRSNAEAFFMRGMTEAMHRLAERGHPAFPISIYYAFKQSESDEEEGTASTGWDTFLEAVTRSGFAISGTWPVRTERSGRSRDVGSNALASSIVLVCRSRQDAARAISRREFIRELNLVLPEALDEMTKGAGEDRPSVAPVDLSQAIIGPGMAVFSKYAAVLEADGTPMSVRTALQLINRFLAEDDFEPDTQFCLHWFEQFGWGEGVFGEADKLARAKATSVDGLAEAGVLFSGKGKVRLRKWSEYPDEWDPTTDSRLPIWEALHQLIRALRQDGESGAGKLLARLQSKSEAIRQLAYRLYTLCERQGWSEHARAYNELVTSWSAIESSAAQQPKRDEQLKLFGGA